MTVPPEGPELQIFVPYWGDPALLHATIESVRSQDDPHWTVTVVDDAYPDPAVAASFLAEDDPRIRYTRNEQNLGIAANFQRCLDLADGEAVMFLGSDDLLEPGFVSRSRALLATYPEVDVFQPGVRVIDADGTETLPLGDRVKGWLRPSSPEPVVLTGEDLAASLLRGNWLYWPSLVFRTARVQQHAFRQDLPIILDLALVLDLVADGASLVVDPTVTFSYRRHASSLSGATLRDGTRFEQDRRFFVGAAEQMQRAGWPRARRAARRRWTSRLHALTLVPTAARARDLRALGQTARHALRT